MVCLACEERGCLDASHGKMMMMPSKKVSVSQSQHLIRFSMSFSVVRQAHKAAARARDVGVTGTTSLLRASGQETVGITKNSFRTVDADFLRGVSGTSGLLARQQLGVTCLETGAREEVGN